MKKEEEKWAVFWCDLLGQIIYSEIEPELTHRHLGELASQAVVFPDGRVGKPSLSTLKRKPENIARAVSGRSAERFETTGARPGPSPMRSLPKSSN